MNSTIFDTFKMTIEDHALQKRYCKLYENVITNNFKFTQQLISDTRKVLNFAKPPVCKTDLPNHQLAFLLSFGVQDTCLSVKKFYESLKDCTEIIEKFSTMSQINLCCLECESFPTVIGVCQVIDGIIEQFGSTGNLDFSEIQISVFDNRHGSWKDLCDCIVDTANSYFKNIELKLNFLKHCASKTSKVLIDTIQKSDLVIIARNCGSNQVFYTNCFLQAVSKEMKENAVLFYFDSSCETCYKRLKSTYSTTNLFFEVKCCHTLHASFDYLRDEQYRLHLPINWETNFHPVMFLTWIKCKEIKVNSFEKEVDRTTLVQVNQPDTPNGHITLAKKKKKVKTSKKHGLLISDAMTRASGACKEENKTLTPGIPGVPDKITKGMKTNRNVESSPKSQYINASSIADFLQKVIPKTECQMNSSTTVNCESFPVAETQFSTSKSKTASSKVTGPFEKVVIPNQDNSTNQMGKGNSLDPLAKVTAAKKENENDSKTVGKNNTTSKKKASDKNNETKSSNGNVSNPTTPKNPAIEIANMNASPTVTKVTASKKGNKGMSFEVSVKNNSPPETKTSKENKEAKSSNRNASIPATQKNLPVVVENGNTPSSGTKSTPFKKENKTKSPEKTSKKNSASKKAASNGNFGPKSGSQSVLVPATTKAKPKKVQLTKKSSRNNATENIRLTGKFARMDLEKRNKDERHKMRAKKSSFAKHANFDYDD